jgi:hypothetical protein
MLHLPPTSFLCRAVDQGWSTLDPSHVPHILDTDTPALFWITRRARTVDYGWRPLDALEVDV